jgi:hypothetical protein
LRIGEFPFYQPVIFEHGAERCAGDRCDRAGVEGSDGSSTGESKT